MGTWERLLEIAEAGPAGKPIRANPAQGDPAKPNNAEQFSTDAGDYFLTKRGQEYTAIFVPKAKMAQLAVGKPTPDRRAAVDMVLAHHDKVSAGV